PTRCSSDLRLLQSTLRKSPRWAGIRVTAGSEDARVDSRFTYSLAHGLQILVCTCFDGALAGVMNDPGALFGLLRRVLAHPDERFDHMCECVKVVIKDDQVHDFGSFNRLQYIHEQVFLSGILHSQTGLF